MKRLLGIGGGLLVVVAVAVFLLYSSLDAIVTSAVEKFGSEITQTQVTLKETKISATDGKGVLRGFRMTNPANFKTKSAVEFDEISIVLDIKTITEDTIVIKDVTIAGPRITYEHSSDGSNIDKIKHNVDSYLGTGNGTPKQKSSEGGKKLIIEKLSIVNGKANVSAAILQGKTMSVDLPDIVLKDIGKSKGGATPGEVANKILDALKNNVDGAVKHLNLNQVKEVVGSVISEATDMLAKGTSGTADLVENNPVGNAVKGLFGN
jgi:hypothetical protein